MMNKNVCSLFIAMTSSALGLNIQLDFLHDEEANKFFSSNPDAKQAVEKAALDLSSVLTNSMSAITRDVYSGSNGSTGASLDWSWTYINPVTGAQETISTPSIDADTVVIYVGTRNLSGSTLGQGGAGGASVFLSGYGYAHEWIGAVEAAEADSNAHMPRGGGPVMGTISGAANYSGYIGQYDLDFGLSVGNLWFDVDTDNDGNRDSDTELSEFWHYDTSTAVAAGKTDLYSVALHEIMHVMGIGTSQDWENLEDGDQWLGSEATLAAGTNQLLSSDRHHIASGLESVRLSDGILQETVMAPTLAAGMRKELTELDLAFLNDIGYTISNAQPVPELSSSLLLCLATALGTARRKR